MSFMNIWNCFIGWKYGRKHGNTTISYNQQWNWGWQNKHWWRNNRSKGINYHYDVRKSNWNGIFTKFKPNTKCNYTLCLYKEQMILNLIYKWKHKYIYNCNNTLIENMFLGLIKVVNIFKIFLVDYPFVHHTQIVNPH